MPSIANQDFKIYGKLSDSKGIPAKYCGELHAALAGVSSVKDYALITDGFVFVSTGDGIARQTGPGNYYDYEDAEFKGVVNTKSSPEYYRALWAIQQAVYAASSAVLADFTEFELVAGNLCESGVSGVLFTNEDGYLIKGTSADGKLASLYLGEKAEDPENCAVVRLETMLPLVGELPLETTEIW